MDQPKYIFLSNDDGYGAQGICALEEAMLGLGEIWKVAPDCERSGYSHAMSFHTSVVLVPMAKRGFLLKNAFPADCANVALSSKLFPKFDLILSGINHGPNLGDDVHYSGTIAVARQGAIHNVPAIAISAVDIETSPQQFLRIGEWLHSWLKENYKKLQRRVTYSINYPVEEKDIPLQAPYPKVSFSYQGNRNYYDEYITLETNEKQEQTLKLEHTSLSYEKQKNSDFEAIDKGNISITPLSTYTTDTKEIQKWL